MNILPVQQNYANLSCLSRCIWPGETELWLEVVANAEDANSSIGEAAKGSRSGPRKRAKRTCENAEAPVQTPATTDFVDLSSDSEVCD